MELEGVSDFREVKTDEGFTCMLTYKGLPWRETVRYIPQQEKYVSVHELYYRLHRELTMTPEERKGRKAFNDAWMKNVIEGRADSRGEFFPSNKQIIEQLEQNG